MILILKYLYSLQNKVFDFLTITNLILFSQTPCFSIIGLVKIDSKISINYLILILHFREKVIYLYQPFDIIVKY